ncbi:MAG: YkgJ family cysteine cluster protein [Nitrospirales bacterium]
MLVPVSPPEAFALQDMVARLPESRRQAVTGRLAEASRALGKAGLLDQLRAVAETERQLSDEDMEPINRAYYALRMPCPFLEQEVCSIYEDRPAACRELLVTSPAALCDDLVNNPVQTLPVPVRMGTALAMLWSDLAGGPGRFIPLPLALEWAERHGQEHTRTWAGPDLFSKALDKVWRYLSWEFDSRGRQRTPEDRA